MEVMSNHIYELKVYDPFLLAGALLVCVMGAWITMRLVSRVAQTHGRQRLGWYCLASMAGASFVWCTHFAAMLAYHCSAGVHLDPLRTGLSLLVMLVAVPLAVMLAVRLYGRGGCMLGGAVFGLGIACMHYIGMAAYRLDAPVAWNGPLVVASVLIGVGFSALALLLALRPVNPRREIETTLALVGAVAGLHFTGMEAMHVVAMPQHMLAAHDNGQFLALGFSVIGGTMLMLIAGIASFVIDGSVRQESYEELHRMAMSDGLTGLPNRISFNERLQNEVSRANRDGEQFAVIGIDLNKFKEINDTRGHAAGDIVLTTLAERFSALLADGEFVARLGGDEFIAIHRTSDSAELHGFVERIQQALNQPIPIEDYVVTSGGSIGVAVYPVDATDSETLISRADMAMYRAKTDPHHTIWYYETALDQTMRERRALGEDLKTAMANGQLSLHYQVQTVVATGEISGYEALLRWEHPERGAIAPPEILQLADESGQIIKLGEWVLQTACAAAAGWDEAVRVAVNMSAAQFLQPRFVVAVQENLARSGLAPDRLVIEITEETVQRNPARALAMADSLQALGVRLALDEFGGTRSVLHMLRAFPFSKLKIDRSLMQQVDTDPVAAQLVRSILLMGRALRISVLAQGIETKGQFSVASAEGCDEGQGYLIGHPAQLAQAAVTTGGGTPGSAMRAVSSPVFGPDI
ncbi:EAL domain-containing protein [Komagataeibacter sp. AV436]|uniref:EAL domain-containing protein n=2 Tax=Komagataeibacter melomenusus TaxID=2766578 RepID=A0ABX2AGL0_9PROT|nr:EAL domain-containing protein [Komagataeibacter melomenusus]NPC66935.1 EAL domain-containing protein [Komagataeibacter melomenusus]